MFDQQQLIQNMLSMARVSFDTGVQAMDTFQAQAEKTISFAIDSMNTVQVETRKSFDTWMTSVKKAREAYMKAVEDGLDNLEQQVSRASEKSR
ncbi:MAG: hypothetical protein QNJ97_11520 [Myxococcota bacterium]|nr:hypothetical protein [Myxococcota bacterium]